MDITLLKGKTGNCPIDSLELTTLIELTFKDVTEDNTLTDDSELKKQVTMAILEKLNHNSSQYKYIVSIVSLKLDGNDNDFTISNEIAASWSPKKDGLLNFKIANESTNRQYLITIFYIFK